jgi:hypothetical protein
LLSFLLYETINQADEADKHENHADNLEGGFIGIFDHHAKNDHDRDPTPRNDSKEISTHEFC